MSETTIGWTAVQDVRGQWHKGFTFNAWQGCAQISPGCAHCYAKGIDQRFAEGMHWGPRAPRQLAGDAYWAQPLAWSARAVKLGVRLRVFAGSMHDWLEDRGDLVEPRARLLDLIAATPNLDWLLLTKRPENLLKLTPWRDMAPGNVWLGVSAENQDYLEERIARIRELGAVVTFVSAEPLLGPLQLGRLEVMLPDWLILGSERGPGARRPEDAWRDAIIASVGNLCADCRARLVWNGLVPAERARAYLLALSRQGVGRNAVAAATDISRTILIKIVRGERKNILASTERRILQVTVDAASDRALIDARPTWRRIQRLMRVHGFTKAEISRRIGQDGVRLQLGKRRITARNAHKIERLLADAEGAFLEEEGSAA